ncbi:MAG: tetratricopeptide repeat protein [Candidatus Eremiobacteraeota bacterium]|nr:tetratricopeptide repeat protein [Candidatus Eremiobacteraeota bacterium]
MEAVAFEELYDAAVAAQSSNDYRRLRKISGDMSALGAATGDRRVSAWGDYFLGLARFFNNESAPADRALRRALSYFRESGDRLAAARTMLNLAMIETEVNMNPGAARRYYEEAGPVIRESGDNVRLAILYGNLGEICRLEGDYEAALRNARESLRLFEAIGDRGRVVWQLVNIAHYLLLRRETTAALEHMRRAYAALQLDGSAYWTTWYFDAWVIFAAKLERWEAVAQLLGYVDKLRSDNSIPRTSGMMPWISLPMERLATVFSQERLHELFTEGEGLSVETAQSLVGDIAASR